MKSGIASHIAQTSDRRVLHGSAKSKRSQCAGRSCYSLKQIAIGNPDERSGNAQGIFGGLKKRLWSFTAHREHSNDHVSATRTHASRDLCLHPRHDSRITEEGDLRRTLTPVDRTSDHTPRLIALREIAYTKQRAPAHGVVELQAACGEDIVAEALLPTEKLLLAETSTSTSSKTGPTARRELLTGSPETVCTKVLVNAEQTRCFP